MIRYAWCASQIYYEMEFFSNVNEVCSKRNIENGISLSDPLSGKENAIAIMHHWSRGPQNILRCFSFTQRHLIHYKDCAPQELFETEKLTDLPETVHERHPLDQNPSVHENVPRRRYFCRRKRKILAEHLRDV